MFLITDLTHFNKDGKVCLAAIHTETLQCIRPVPYVNLEFCRNNQALPGCVITGRYGPHAAVAPHVEDVTNLELEIQGPSNWVLLKEILNQTLVQSLEEGFGGPIDGKSNPSDQPAKRSLITYKPEKLRFEQSSYNPEKLKVHFDDYRYVPINDLGYWLHFDQNPNQTSINFYNNFLRTHPDVYLRLGLTREHKEKYWLQVNGVYTFPDPNLKVRRYG